MKEQSVRFGTEVITDTVTTLDLSKRPFKYTTEFGGQDQVHTADSVIVATGASARRLYLPGEDQYWQKGISACAVCDGAVPIFRNKPLVVIGGGDSAAEEALFLTKYASHVTVLVRKDKLRASKTMANRLLAHPKVTVRYTTQAYEVRGGENGLMNELVIRESADGSKDELFPANGLFYAIGHDPATQLVKGQLETDEDGYIVTTPGTTLTSVEGVFAAGDVQDKKYRQAITSAGKSISGSPSTFRLVVRTNCRHRVGLHGRSRGREVYRRAPRGVSRIDEEELDVRFGNNDFLEPRHMDFLPAYRLFKIQSKLA